MISLTNEYRPVFIVTKEKEEPVRSNPVKKLYFKPIQVEDYSKVEEVIEPIIKEKIHKTPQYRKYSPKIYRTPDFKLYDIDKGGNNYNLLKKNNPVSYFPNTRRVKLYKFQIRGKGFTNPFVEPTRVGRYQEVFNNTNVFSEVFSNTNAIGESFNG